MSLKIHKVVNASKPEDEIIWLEASKSTSLKGYAIIDKTFDANGKISNEFRHIYLFSEHQVAKDDFVALHSGKGDFRKVKNNRGTFNHHFYWGSGSCIWNDKGGDTAGLISINEIDKKVVPPVNKG